jgi:hypothetical protein
MDLEALPAVITAVSILLASIGALVAGIITALRTGRVEKKTTAIEANVNGTAHTAAAAKLALEDKVDRLQAQLAEVAAAATAAATAAREAAADVRAERAAPAAKGPE